jgi:UDP-N-acetylglucosamine--dolichyl-phosphate N-acetylglucosaminephosphotransferase
MYHTYLTILIPAIVAAVVTYIGIKFTMGYMMDSGVTAMDHNKKKPVKLASGVGISVAFGLTLGLLVYIFGASFPTPQHPIYQPIKMQILIDLFGIMLSILLISVVGLLDDINVRSEMVQATDMKDTKKGMKQWQKPVLTLLGAIPLMVINAGVPLVRVPFIGAINLGIVYPLIVIPLAVVFAANAFNLLGGFDGIATGTGLIASLALLLYSVAFGVGTSGYLGTMVAAVLSACLVVMFAFNVYPAKVIPGDSFTYGVGAALAGIMILGSMESFGLIIIFPWLVEFILHLRKKFKVRDLGILQKDMTFKAPYGKKIYSWTHLIMNLKRCREWEVSMYMWFIEIGFVALAFGLKFLNLL